MALYSYTKKTIKFENTTVQVLSQLFLMTGIIILFWSFFPIVSYQVQSYISSVISPKSPVAVDDSLSASKQILGAFDEYSTNLNDFSNASLWFPSLKVIKKKSINTVILPESYTLSIPKLNIYNAVVNVGGEDLNKGLIHYLPVSAPGQVGNVAIFGHSTLPQLFKDKDYKSIFTYLPTLQKGDEFYVTMNDKEYKYSVTEMFVVKPDQISVLDQKQDASYITLITCVPPGTFWNRLIVRAALVE